jgi:hypothetical protein
VRWAEEIKAELLWPLERKTEQQGAILEHQHPQKYVSYCSTELTKVCNHEQLGIAAETKDRMQTEPATTGD